jgi:hypothetical protein
MLASNLCPPSALIQGDRYLRRILVVGTIAVLRAPRRIPGSILTQLLARGYVEGVGLAVAVTAGFQRIVGHNDEAGGVYRVHNGHGTAFANEYSHFRFTPFIGATGSATAIALGYYREYFHACDDVLCGLSHFVPLVQQGCRATMQTASDRSQ